MTEINIKNCLTLKVWEIIPNVPLQPGEGQWEGIVQTQGFMVTNNEEKVTLHKSDFRWFQAVYDIN